MSSNIRIEIDDTALDAMIAQFDTATATGGGAGRIRSGKSSFPSATRRQLAELYFSEFFGIDISYPTAKRRFNPVSGMTRGFSDFQKLNDELLKKPGILDSLKNLPTIDRNYRTILGQVPGGRAVSQTIFRAKWIGKMMDDYPVETAAIIITTGIMAVKAYSAFVDSIKKDRAQYATMLGAAQPNLTKEYIDRYVMERESWWRRWITGG